MLIQISSGQGPTECEFAAGLFTKELCKIFPNAEIVKFSAGREKNCYRKTAKSPLLQLWGCKPPFFVEKIILSW